MNAHDVVKTARCKNVFKLRMPFYAQNARIWNFDDLGDFIFFYIEYHEAAIKQAYTEKIRFECAEWNTSTLAISSNFGVLSKSVQFGIEFLYMYNVVSRTNC